VFISKILLKVHGERLPTQYCHRGEVQHQILEFQRETETAEC
jgi:hypothetical protein